MHLPKHSRYMSQIDVDSSFSIHSSCSSPKNINDPIRIINDITMNPMGLALWQGNLKDFRSLMQHKGGKVELMEKLFEKQGKSGIELIIERGHCELFKFYLPIFLLDFNSSDIMQKPLIHQVILNDRIEILKFIREYFYHVKPPSAFSFHCIDQKSGENSALVACRGINFEIIQYLKSLGCDFSLKNFKRQTALQIAVSTMQKKGFNMQVFAFLLEKCGIDVVYNWEAVALQVEDCDGFEVYRKCLEKFGVYVDKEEVWKKFEEKREENNLERDSDVELTAMSSISLIDLEDFSVSIWRNQ